MTAVDMRIRYWSSGVCSSDLMCALYLAHLARPGVGDAEVALGGAFELLALGIDDDGSHAEERPRGRARLRRRGAGQRRDHDAAGLGLPPGDRKCTRLNSSHLCSSRMPSYA